MPDIVLPIETERLRIRLLERRDLGPFVNFMTDTESTRYLAFGDEQKTETGARELFAAIVGSYERPESVAAYGLEDKASGAYVGSCGFAPVTEGALECYYTILSGRRRKGYAHEAMQGPVRCAARPCRNLCVLSPQQCRRSRPRSQAGHGKPRPVPSPAVANRGALRVPQGVNRPHGGDMDQPQVDAIIEVMEAKNYEIFKNERGHDLNIVGIRTDDDSANSFNDWLTVFYSFGNVWNFFAFPATTDPGTYYRRNPLNVRGTAIMKPGNYRSAYKVGRHRNYKALQQQGNITVFRDANKDATIDTAGVEEDTGLHAVNIHRANAHRPSIQVGRWSAGCQVVQDPDQFAFLLMLCDRAKEKFGNNFTYTLLEEEDFA